MAGPLGEKLLGGAADSRLLAGRDRLAGRSPARPRLDLDQCQDAVTAGDDVDLADRHPVAARDDTPAGQTQSPDAEKFGPAPSPLGRPMFGCWVFGCWMF